MGSKPIAKSNKYSQEDEQFINEEVVVGCPVEVAV